MVELALSLVILMLIVYGITEFSRVMYVKNRLSYAAREGARAAVVSAQVNAFGAATAAALNVYPGTVVSMSPLYPVPGSGAPVTVTVRINFATVVPHLSASFAIFNNILLTGEATMRYEQ